LDKNGAAQPGTPFHSRRPEPFGFAFAPNHVAVVSDAVNGKPGAAALSSYDVRKGNLKVVTAAAGDTQTAACWVAVTDDGAYAYAVNTASGTISSYSISVGGKLSL